MSWYLSKVRMNRNKSDAEWLKTVLSSGTLADKMAARALLIQVGHIPCCTFTSFL